MLVPCNNIGKQVLYPKPFQGNPTALLRFSGNQRHNYPPAFQPLNQGDNPLKGRFALDMLLLIYPVIVPQGLLPAVFYDGLNHPRLVQPKGLHNLLPAQGVPGIGGHRKAKGLDAQRDGVSNRPVQIKSG